MKYIEEKYCIYFVTVQQYCPCRMGYTITPQSKLAAPEVHSPYYIQKFQTNSHFYNTYMKLVSMDHGHLSNYFAHPSVSLLFEFLPYMMVSISQK